MKFTLNAFLIILTLSHTAIAEEPDAYLKKAIASGSFCESKVFQQLKNSQKNKYSKLHFKPSDKLMELAVSYEMMCPWSIEKDFNGDNKDDWMGYVKIKNEYHLLAYISKFRFYELMTLSKSETPPKNNYLRWVQTKHLKTFTKEKIPKTKANYALQVVNLNKMADFYLWTDSTFKKIITTSQFF